MSHRKCAIVQRQQATADHSDDLLRGQQNNQYQQEGKQANMDDQLSVSLLDTLLAHLMQFVCHVPKSGSPEQQFAGKPLVKFCIYLRPASAGVQRFGVADNPQKYILAFIRIEAHVLQQ